MRKALYFAATALVLAAFAAPAADGQKVLPIGAAKVSVVAMPEPSTRALLAVDLLTVGAVIFAFRRRANGTNR